MREYSRLNISCWTHCWTTALTSSCDGHSSESITSFPSAVSARGSVTRFLCTDPASAKATTSGGDHRRLAMTHGWVRPSHMRLTERTAKTPRFSFHTTASTSELAAVLEVA